MVEAFVPSAYFLQVLRRAALSQKMLRWRRRERLFEPTLRGCSSVVEHLLAKEDVASSSLVTRSTGPGWERDPASQADLGSARASRAGDGALAIAHFYFPEHCGEALQ